MNFKKYIPVIILCILIVVSIAVSIYYTLNISESVVSTDINFKDTKREEIQRYIGYENLLSRYLTMPYDVSMNTNQQGSFVDIGYLYILFIPLILITLVKKSIWKWTIAILSILLLALSANFSFILVGNDQYGAADALNILSHADSNFFHKFLAYVYHFFYLAFGWLTLSIENISGDSDYVTYPIVISGFILTLLAIYSLFENRKLAYQVIILLSASFGFFFFMFSSGITWYGYLFFLLLLVGMVFYFFKTEEESSGLYQTVRMCFVYSAGLWMCICLLARISNIQPGIALQHQGKAIISPDVYFYNTGKIKATSELQDRYITPGFSDTIKEINSDLNTKVYKVGTGLTYFIKQNHKRVIFDNQLGIFSQILEEYQNKYVISDILKVSGVKYLIIDLNTPSIDNTPERTLTRKYLQIMDYVDENDSVRLICTDNISQSEETKEISYSLSGETLRRGSFAIYEIN